MCTGERRHVVVPVRVEHRASHVDLDLVVVAVVAGIAGLKHDLDAGGFSPHVRIDIASAEGRAGRAIAHDEARYKF